MIRRFNDLPMPADCVLAEYIWVGNLLHPRGVDLRSKTRTLDVSEVKSLDDLPLWSFDGSSVFVCLHRHVLSFIVSVIAILTFYFF